MHTILVSAQVTDWFKCFFPKLPDKWPQNSLRAFGRDRYKSGPGHHHHLQTTLPFAFVNLQTVFGTINKRNESPPAYPSAAFPSDEERPTNQSSRSKIDFSHLTCWPQTVEGFKWSLHFFILSSLQERARYTTLEIKISCFCKWSSTN